MKCLPNLLFVIAITGCAVSPTHPPAATYQVPQPGKSVALKADGERALVKLTGYVNAQLRGRTYTPTQAIGQTPRPYPVLTRESWSLVRHADGRWIATKTSWGLAYVTPDDGLHIVASIAGDGSDPRIEVCEWLPL